MPIIPAIPRSLEKRIVKEHVRSSQDRGGTGSPDRPISPKQQEGSLVETTTLQSQAVPSRARFGSDEKDNVIENGVQEAVVDKVLEKEVAGGKSTFQGQSSQNGQKPTTSAEDSTTSIPNRPQDFGIEKHGFRLPPPFYPSQSPPPAISSDVSPANEPATASEETSPTVEEENGSSMSQQSSVENHVTLNAAAPTFHAHPTPPTDGTTSPAELSTKGPNPSQSPHPQHESTQPTDILSPIHLPYEGYEVSQNISFYAPPQSSDDPSSPNHSVYQGYAYAPTSYDYSREAQASQQQIESPQRNEGGVLYEQRYESQPSYYNNQLCHPVLGSQPPLTPSRTPLDASAQPWSYSNGLPPTVPYSYGYVPAYHPQPAFEPPMRSASQGTRKSDESNRKADLLEDRSDLLQLNASETKVAQLSKGAWRDDNEYNDYMSSQGPLVAHLLQQFNVEEFADCHLTLVHENLRFEKTRWSLSSLLLAQSPKLRDLLKSAGIIKEGKKAIEMRLTDRFITPWAMNLALRLLYGERSEIFLLAIVHSSFGVNAEMWAMDACLAFAAAGHVLGMEAVVLQGLQTASSILDWDTLEHALSFGLKNGPIRGTSAFVDAIPLYAGSPVWSRGSDPSSATNLTPLSSSADSRQERSRAEGLSAGSSQSFEVNSAQDLQTYCLQWIASRLDESWEFDPSARPLAEIDRLPTTAESRSPLSKSRLSRIQFGEHPSEIHAKASDRNVLVSSIVLSLPFVALKYMLNLRSQPLLRQLSTIVKERERRRQIVLQSKSVPWTQRFAAKEHEWAEVGYTEWVEATGGHVALARTFTGIDRQVSEPSTPGQKKS